MIPARHVLTGLLLSTTMFGSTAFAQVSTAPDAVSNPTVPVSPPQAAEDTAPAADAAAVEGEEIVVTGRFIPNEKRATSEIVSLLNAEDLARGGDSDIAGSLTRVTGLSLVGGRFVYVRGLGGRYSSALLDGSVLPSPEPLRRVTPLDVFPTDLLSGALVQKTYSVEYPGEFAGGLIALRSRAVPEENFFEFGISGGVNDNSTFQNGIGFQGGDLDIIGFRDNTYTLPEFVKTNPSLVGFDAGQRQLAGRALVANGPGFSLDRYELYPDFGGNVSIGRRFDIGGMSAGLLLAGVYDQQIRNQFGVRNRFAASGGMLTPVQSFDPAACVGVNSALNAASCGVFQTAQTVTLGLIASAGLEIDGDNTITAKSIVLRKTDKIGENRRGVSPSSFGGDTVTDYYRLAFIEQELWINQLNGEHKFSLGAFPDSVFTWRGSYDRASRVTPYRTDYLYLLTAGDTSFQLSGAPAQFGINFTGLLDDNYEGGADLILKGDPFGFESVFKFGGLYTRKNRDYASRRYSFDFPGGTAALRRFVPEIIFSPDNIGPGGFQLVQTDGPANSYTASQEIIGGYVTTELQIADPVRITAGVRYEHSKQIVNGAVNGALAVGGACRQSGALVGVVTPILCTLTADRLLPAATVTFEFADNMQLRGGYSRTLSRPDLRELSPAVILNIEEDVEEQGDPNLRLTTIDNFDARYEWYFGEKQLFSLGGFYKKLKNPIERSLSTFGEEGRRTFIQIDSAEVYGGEAELTLTLPFDRWVGGEFFEERRFFAIGNFTYSKSSTQIAAAQLGVLTNSKRPLEGQSEILGNLQLGYEMKGERLAFLLNYAGKRISDVGTNQRPDIYEEPPIDLDFTYAKSFPIGDREVEFSVKISNILNDSFLRNQGGEIYEAYDIGRTYSAGLKIRL